MEVSWKFHGAFLAVFREVAQRQHNLALTGTMSSSSMAMSHAGRLGGEHAMQTALILLQGRNRLTQCLSQIPELVPEALHVVLVRPLQVAHVHREELHRESLGCLVADDPVQGREHLQVCRVVQHCPSRIRSQALEQQCLLGADLVVRIAQGLRLLRQLSVSLRLVRAWFLRF